MFDKFIYGNFLPKVIPEMLKGIHIYRKPLMALYLKIIGK